MWTVNVTIQCRSNSLTPVITLSIVDVTIVYAFALFAVISYVHTEQSVTKTFSNSWKRRLYCLEEVLEWLNVKFYKHYFFSFFVVALTEKTYCSCPENKYLLQIQTHPGGIQYKNFIAIPGLYLPNLSFFIHSSNYVYFIKFKAKHPYVF